MQEFEGLENVRARKICANDLKPKKFCGAEKMVPQNNVGAKSSFQNMCRVKDSEFPNKNLALNRVWGNTAEEQREPVFQGYSQSGHMNTGGSQGRSPGLAG